MTLRDEIFNIINMNHAVSMVFNIKSCYERKYSKKQFQKNYDANEEVKRESILKLSH